MRKQYDLVVIGGGPGGYVCATHASKLGLSVALIESYGVGGTCLHKGCIPTKALLVSSRLFSRLSRAEELGVELGTKAFSLRKAQKRKRKVIEQLHKAVQFLLKTASVDTYNGTGKLLNRDTVAVQTEKETIEFNSKFTVLATGSVPRQLGSIPIDGKNILTSDHLLELEDIPSSLAIIGGGYIGVEFANFFAHIGSPVTIIELLPRILPTMDEDISRELARSFKRRGIKLLTSARVESATSTASGVEVALSEPERKTLNFDKLLVAVGRRASTDGLPEAGIELTEAGFVRVDDEYRTSLEGVFAIGDLAGKCLLAHSASAEGIAVAELIARGTSPRVNYDFIPACVYTEPEIASVGLTEEEAKERGYDVRVEKTQFKANARAVCEDESGGFFKLITETKYGRLLGVQIIGPSATELISASVIGAGLEITTEELTRIVLPHPTFSEAFTETARIFFSTSPST